MAMPRFLSQLDFEQLKLPIGFLKPLEFLFVLVAYTAFSAWKFDFTVTCHGQVHRHNYEITSFALDDIEFRNCNDTGMQFFETGYHGEGSFFILTSYMSIAFTVGMLFLYMYRWDLYAAEPKWPHYDCYATIVASTLWFVNFVMWWYCSGGLIDLTSPESVAKRNEELQFCVAADECELKTYAMYAPVRVAVVAALGNCILFMYNIWIVYKETSWFHDHEMRRQPHNLESPYSLN
uniref:MARVEL domain-containing protein n=1 Tax=Panagrellus redivivus TaxID=6233 RepID=A0A7E4V1L2_PANRE